MQNKAIRYPRYALCLAGFIINASPVLAADEATSPAELEQIVVTAERKSERLQDAPVAVTALSATSKLNLTSLSPVVNGMYLGAAGLEAGSRA